MTTTATSLPKPKVFDFFGHQAKLFDLLAALPLIAWCAGCLYFQWGDIVRDVQALQALRLEYLGLLDLVSRITRFAFAGLLGFLLIVRRTPIKRYPGILPRAIALFGAYGGVAAQVLPVSPPLTLWLIGSSLLTIGGITFAIYSLLHLGRSISILPESRKLVISGPYSIVRHPLYFGEQTAIVGIALQSASPLVALILTVQMMCQLYRMRCEEQILQDSFDEYEEYRKRTPFILPWLY